MCRNRKNGIKQLKDKNRRIKSKRNKQQTIKLFREAAKRLLFQGGIKALRINSLQKEAGKSKSLIYEYFGGIAGVLRDALDTNDVWLSYNVKLADILSQKHDDHGKALAIGLLKDHLRKFSKDRLAKEISLLELSSEGNNVLKELLESRENLGNRLFDISDRYFSNERVSIRMVLAILISGMNYMLLRADNNNSAFCGININTPEGLELMNKTLEQIIAWAYEHAA